MALSICSVVRLRTSRRFVPARIALCRSAMRRSEEHTSELQSPCNLVCRLLLEKKKLDAMQSPSVSDQPCPPIFRLYAAAQRSYEFLLYRRMLHAVATTVTSGPSFLALPTPTVY